MRRVTMFWGCTIPARFPFIEKSTRLVLEELGLELVDAAGFTCCPETTLVKAVDEDAYYLTAARNLAVAERLGNPLLTPCNGCYSTFKSVMSTLKVDWRLHESINQRLAPSGLQYRGVADVRHLVEWLSEDFGPATLSKRVAKPMWGMRIAVHYGCHLLRPSPAIRWDSPTAPTKFENLVRALGATVVDYETKMDCCGNALDRVGERQASLDMCNRKLKDLRAHDVDALVVSCPSCFLQFDLNQAAQLRASGETGVPTLYITELVALALGMEPSALGLDMHRVSVEPFLEKWPLKLAQREAIAQEFDLSELQTCAACKACDDDCPVAQIDTAFLPSAIMGQLLAGDLQGIFERGDIWRCTDCLICYERCHSRFGMAEVFQRVKMMAQQEGKVPVAVLSNYQTFTETGMLGTPRQSAREKLGLSPLPEDGSADLKSLLREKGEQE